MAKAKRSPREHRAQPAPAPALRSVDGAVEKTADLDRVIHDRLRLGIVSALCVSDRLGFTDLRALLKTSDGNLSVHARKLEDAGYVSCKKTFRGRTPHTEYSVTAKGRRALQRYLDHMEALIAATRGGG